LLSKDIECSKEVVEIGVIHAEGNLDSTEVIIGVGRSQGVVLVVELLSVVGLFEAEVRVAVTSDVTHLPGGQRGCRVTSVLVVSIVLGIVLVLQVNAGNLPSLKCLPRREIRRVCRWVQRHQ